MTCRTHLSALWRLIPVQSLRTGLTTPDHEIEMAVAVDVHQRGEAIVALEAVVLGKSQVDEVVPETEFPSRRSNREGQRTIGNHQAEMNETHREETGLVK